MAVRSQWVGWRYGQKRGKKREKVPIDPRTGGRARVNDPATWGTMEEATRSAAARDLDGIGFIFAEGDGYVGVDLDGCLDVETGEIAPWASRIIKGFGSYTEVSPSRTGVKIVARGRKPEGRKRRAAVEMYDRERFFAITGAVLGGCRTVESRQEAIERLQGWLNAADSRAFEKASPEAVPIALEDEELLRKARAAANGPRFRRLYDEGDASGYGSESEADMALAGVLAFWTGCDPERMERLFGASALGQRAKWRGRPVYRRDTIELAASRCEKVYDPAWKGPGGSAPEASEEVMEDLDQLHRFAVADPWTGRSGPGERWVFQAMLVLARGTGTMTEEGVVAPASSRALAVLCGKRRQKVEELLKFLAKRGRVERLSTGQGNRGSRFLLLHPATTNRCQEEEEHSGGGVVATNRCQEEPPPVYLLGNASSGLSDLLARVEKDTDALVVEKVAARPGMDLGELAQALGRARRSVQRMLAPVVEGGFIEERDGRYHPVGRLAELVERHLEDSGSNERARELRADYEEERRCYAEDYEEERRRLKEGEEEVPEGDAEALAAVEELEAEREEEKIGSEAEVFEMALAMLPRPEEPVILPPLPGRDPLVHRDTAKARIWRERKEIASV